MVSSGAPGLCARERGEVMPRYLVRANCEYSLVIEAASEREALEAADKADFAEWEQAWSESEVEAIED